MPFILRIKHPKLHHTLRSVKNSFKQRHLVRQKDEPNEKVQAEQFSAKIDLIVNEIQSTDRWLAEKIAETNAIYRRIRIIRETNDNKADKHQNLSEWQFAAIIVDRICLIIFTLLFSGACLTFCVKAPYLVA
jgi:hypothetical protein